MDEDITLGPVGVSLSVEEDNGMYSNPSMAFHSQ